MAFILASNWFIAMEGLLMHTNLTHTTHAKSMTTTIIEFGHKPPFLHRRSSWVRESGIEKAMVKWSEGVGTKTLALWRDPAWGPPSGSLALSDTPPPRLSVKAGSLIIIRVSMEAGGEGNGRPTKTWPGYASYWSMAWHTCRNLKWLGKCVCWGMEDLDALRPSEWKGIPDRLGFVSFLLGTAPLNIVLFSKSLGGGDTLLYQRVIGNCFFSW